MNADLEWLIKLQKVDTKIFTLTGEERKSETNIKKLKIAVEELLFKKLKIANELNEKIDYIIELKDDIEDHKRILEQKKLDLTNDRKTKKEHIRREIKKLEKAVVVFSEKVLENEQLEKKTKKRKDDSQKEIDIVQQNILDEENEIKQIVKKSKRTFNKLMKEREIVDSNIRRPFLNHYNRIRKIRNGIAITYVDDTGLCNGCKIHVPYQLRQKIKLLDDYNICEGCGRILVTEEVLD